jgi:hypothetical protein
VAALVLGEALGGRREESDTYVKQSHNGKTGYGDDD